MAEKGSSRDLSVDFKTLLRMSASDRREIIRDNRFQEEILNALTPFQMRFLFPDYYTQYPSGSSSGYSGGGGTDLSSLVSGLSGGTLSTKYSSTATSATGDVQPPMPSKPKTTQPKGEYTPGWYKRFMDLKTDQTQSGVQGGLAKVPGQQQQQAPAAPGQVSVDKNGYVNKQQFYQTAVDKFRNSPLNGFVPQDGKKYGIDGTPESWARFAMRVAQVESGFKTGTTNRADPGGSFGLFQWGLHYGINKDNWRDPNAQLDAFVTYSNQWVVNGGGYILPPKGVQAKRYGGYGGFGAVFSTVRNDKVNGRDAISGTEFLNETPIEQATKPIPRDQSKTGAIMPDQSPSGGPTLRPGLTPGEERAQRQGTPRQQEQLIDPDKLNELNLKRPGHIQGKVTFEGTNMQFDFGTGGARGSRGTIPYGVHEIMPGRHTGSKYPSFNNNSFYIRDMFDPQAIQRGTGKRGDMRSGILFHKGSDWGNLYTHGCLAIKPEQWPAFRDAMDKFQEQSGGGPVYMEFTPDGNVRVTATRPQGVKFQSANEFTRKLPDLPPGADPGLAAENVKKLPAGLPQGLVDEFTKLSAEQQNAFITKLNSLGPEGIQLAARVYEEDLKDPSKKTQAPQDMIEVIQNTPVGELPKVLTSEMEGLPIPQAGDKLQWNMYKGDPRAQRGDIVKIQTPYGEAEVNKKSAVAYKGFFNDLKQAGAPIKTVSGSYQIRGKQSAGPGHNPGGGWSQHSYGNAIDLDGAAQLSKEMREWLKENQAAFDAIKKKWGMQSPKGDEPHMEWGGAISQEAADQLAAEMEAKNLASGLPTPPKESGLAPNVEANLETATAVPEMPNRTGDIMPDRGPDGGPTLKPAPVAPIVSGPGMNTDNLNVDPLLGYSRGAVPPNAFDALSAEERSNLRLKFLNDPDAANDFVRKYNKKTLNGFIKPGPDTIAQKIRETQDYKDFYSKSAEERQRILDELKRQFDERNRVTDNADKTIASREQTELQPGAIATSNEQAPDASSATQGSAPLDTTGPSDVNRDTGIADRDIVGTPQSQSPVDAKIEDVIPVNDSENVNMPGQGIIPGFEKGGEKYLGKNKDSKDDNYRVTNKDTGLSADVNAKEINAGNLNVDQKGNLDVKPAHRDNDKGLEQRITPEMMQQNIESDLKNEEANMGRRMTQQSVPVSQGQENANWPGNENFGKENIPGSIFNATSVVHGKTQVPVGSYNGSRLGHEYNTDRSA